MVWLNGWFQKILTRIFFSKFSLVILGAVFKNLLVLL